MKPADPAEWAKQDPAFRAKQTDKLKEMPRGWPKISHPVAFDTVPSDSMKGRPASYHNDHPNLTQYLKTKPYKIARYTGTRTSRTPG